MPGEKCVLSLTGSVRWAFESTGFPEYASQLSLFFFFFIFLVLHDVAISEGDHDPHMIFCTSDVCIVISFIKQPLLEIPRKGPAQLLLHRRADLISSLTELCLWGSPTNPLRKDQTERPQEKHMPRKPPAVMSPATSWGVLRQNHWACVSGTRPPPFLTPRPHKTGDKGKAVASHSCILEWFVTQPWMLMHYLGTRCHFMCWGSFVWKHNSPWSHEGYRTGRNRENR